MLKTQTVVCIAHKTTERFYHEVRLRSVYDRRQDGALWIDRHGVYSCMDEATSLWHAPDRERVCNIVFRGIDARMLLILFACLKVLTYITIQDYFRHAHPRQCSAIAVVFSILNATRARERAFFVNNCCHRSEVYSLLSIISFSQCHVLTHTDVVCFRFSSVTRRWVINYSFGVTFSIKLIPPPKLLINARPGVY